MENIILKRYMSKSLVNLFKTNQSSIAYCEVNNFTRNNIMLNNIEDISTEFDAVIDRNNVIHIVYQDSKKNIMYALNINSEWKKYELLKARENAAAVADKFRIFRNNGYFGVLYVIEHNNETMLCSQFADGNSVPKAIGKISCEFSDFIALTDFSADIYVFYCEETGGGFGFRRFVWSKKEWSEFKALEIPNNSIMFSAFIDESNLLHICYKTTDGLFYRNAEISFDGFLWRNEKLLTRQHTNMSLCPIINKVEDTLIISWGTFDRIIAVMSGDNGESWSKLREIGIARGGNIQKIRISMPIKSLNSEFYGYILNNKLNVPMLPRFIDCEFERENDFNNDFLGVSHNDGYEAERFFKNYLNARDTIPESTDKDIDIQNNNSKSGNTAGLDNYNTTNMYSGNIQFPNGSGNNFGSRQNGGLTSFEIERVKERLTRELIKNNSDNLYPNSNEAISEPKTVIVKRNNNSKTQTDINKKNIYFNADSNSNSNINVNLSGELKNISAELIKINSQMEKLIELQNESCNNKINEKTEDIKFVSGQKYFLKKKRKKAILYKLHIKR